MSRLQLAITTVLTLAVVGPAFAQPGRGGDPSQMADRFFGMMDRNRDGRLDEDGKKAFKDLCTQLSNECLHFSDESIIATVLDAAAISAKYPDGTIPNSLLLDLLNDQKHPEDAQIALEIMESIDAQ